MNAQDKNLEPSAEAAPGREDAPLRLLHVGELIRLGDVMRLKHDPDMNPIRVPTVWPGCIVTPEDGNYYYRLEAAPPAAQAAPEPSLGEGSTKVTEALRALVDSLNALIRESEGVAGLHLNGDLATWHDLLAGGRYESWLATLADAEAALSRVEGR